MELKSLTPKLLAILAVLFMGGLAQATPAVTTAGVNVRSGPNARILTAVPRGTSLNILGRQGNWSRVQFRNGGIGWIHSRYLNRNVTTRTASRPTQGGATCVNCLAPAVAEPIRQASQQIAAAAYSGQGPQCISNRLLAAARDVVRQNYGNRTRGGGACALAVRQSLNRARIWPGGGIGHAKDMVPSLKSMGFVNLLRPGMTPENAPAGTILVYGKARARGCRGLGATYGHVEIKEGQNSFYYDARVTRNIQRAFGSDCRPLIGVMQMGNNCRTCSAELKRTCGV